MAFRFNISAKYHPGVQGRTQSLQSPCKARIQVRINSHIDSFEVQYPDVFEKYHLPHLSSDLLVNAWSTHSMQFWQNQLNFAVWCATTGCGVSAEDHLTNDDPMMLSVYRFHVYYQVRRILDEMQAPLVQDQAWHATNNPYNRRAYERICNEFGVSPHTDWRVKGLNHGLGRVYEYWTNNGYHPVDEDGEYNPKKMSFKKKTTNEVLHVNFIKQDSSIPDEAWRTFILKKSIGFTRPGVERLNDSIRTYVWAILGAQAQTRTGILGSGTAFDAQKQFLVNIEDAISSRIDLPSAITRYQNVLQYAGSEVNFVFGTGLYMAPSNMLLHVGSFSGYNNKIVIATSDQTLGLNNGLNMRVAPHVDIGKTHNVIKPGPVLKASKPLPTSHTEHEEHEDEKTALAVGGIVMGLLAIWLLH